MTLEGCREMFLNVPVPLAGVQDAVPPSYRILGAAMGQATLGVGVATCEAIGFDGVPGGPVGISDVGVMVEAPEGSPGLHVYQLWQSTNASAHAARVAQAGVPTHLSPMLNLDQGERRPPSAARAEAEAAGSAYSLEGVALVPPAPVDVTITWWRDTEAGRVRLVYRLTGDSAEAQGVVTADPGSEMERLLSGASARGAGFLPTFAGTGTFEAA